MRLSGLAGFFLYDALQRSGREGAQTFCLRQQEGDDEYVFPQDSGLGAFRIYRAGLNGLHLELGEPRESDRVALVRGRPVLAIDKGLDTRTDSMRLDARMEGDEVMLMVSSDIASFTLSETG